MKEIFDELNESPGVTAPPRLAVDIVRENFLSQLRQCILRGDNCPASLKAKVHVGELPPDFLTTMPPAVRAAMTGALLWDALSETFVNGDRPAMHKWLRERNTPGIPPTYAEFNRVIDQYVTLLSSVYAVTMEFQTLEPVTTTTAQANILPQVFNQLYNAS